MQSASSTTKEAKWKETAVAFVFTSAAKLTKIYTAV